MRAPLAAACSAGFRLPQPEQATLEQAIGDARAALGERAAAVWAQGQALTLEEAIAYALEQGAAG